MTPLAIAAGPAVEAAPLLPPFMANAMLVLGILAAAGGLVGVQLNLRGLEFLGDGLVHSIFPGVVIGFLVAGADGTYLGAGIAALAATILLTLAARRGLGDDAATAVVLSGAFSLGVVIVSTTTQYTGGLEHLLFGQLLTVDASDLAIVAALCAAAAIIVLGTWRGQTMISFDRAGARAAGLGIGLHELALNVAIALVVVAGARAIGNLLVLAILIIPPAVGRLASRRIGWVAPISVLAALLPSIGGLWLAWWLSMHGGANVSPSGLVVIALTAVYLLAAALRTLADAAAGRRASRRRTWAIAAELRDREQRERERARQEARA